MCCYSIAKYLLFIFNFVFWLAGAAILGVGIWLNVDTNIQNSIEVAGIDVYYAGAIVFIVAGCIMLLVGFCGCCGAIKESTCLLGMYFTFLFIILGLEVGIGIWALVTYPTLEAAISDNMAKNNLTKAGTDNVLIALQQNLQCCGNTQGCHDWDGNSLGSYGCGCDQNSFDNASYCVLLTSTGPPGSRCTADSMTGASTTHVYAQPCDQAVYQLVADNLIIVGAIGLAIGLAEILGMIISMCLCCSIKDKKKAHGV